MRGTSWKIWIAALLFASLQLLASGVVAPQQFREPAAAKQVDRPLGQAVPGSSAPGSSVVPAPMATRS